MADAPTRWLIFDESMQKASMSIKHYDYSLGNSISCCHDAFSLKNSLPTGFPVAIILIIYQSADSRND